MGVVHKLKPEVLSFIIENKQNNPALSCRNLTALVFEQLHIQVSKSSVNAVFKENNLSMPIGRRPKGKKKKFKMPALPVIETARPDRLGDLPEKIIQDQIGQEDAEEKAAFEATRAKAQEEARLRELERIAKEAEEKKRLEEEARRLAEEKAAVELAKIKAIEEARQRQAEQLAKEAEENKRLEEEARRLAEEKAAVELAKIKAQEEARQRELEKIAQELAAEKRKREEEARKLAEEKAAFEATRAKAQEEARQRQAEQLAKETEEKKRLEEEARRLEEEKATREAELKAERERLVKLAEEEVRKLVEERAAFEAVRLKAQEEARLRELERIAKEAEEKKRLEEEARRLAEEKIKREEEAHRLEEEKAIREAELKAEKERLAKLVAEEARRLAEEKAAVELAKIKAQEEARQRELEKIAQELAAEKRKREEEARKLAEEKAAFEATRAKAQEEARLRELERIAKEAEEKKRKEEEGAAEEAGLKAEREKWARLAEEEQRAKQRASKPEPASEEAVVSQAHLVAPEILPEDRVCSGAMILKALDSLIGGSREINALISRVFGSNPQDTLNLTESLIFKSMFNKDIYSTLGDLVGVQYSAEKINGYYSQIKQITDIGIDVSKIITNVFTEAKGVKFHFTDESIIHLDGQLYSSWPGTRFPYDFANTVAELKNNLNKHFIDGVPLVLFSPPGYDIFPKDFFSLLLNIGSQKNCPDNLILFGNQLEELETITLNSPSPCCLVFGLWPWQFTSSRKVKKIGDFYLKYIKEIDRDLYLGEVEIDLFRASTNQSISLKGCAVKTDLKEKIRLVILNTNSQQLALDELAGIYLSRWPNFEEAFQDFSRKIELFTYSSAEQKSFSRDSFGLDTAGITKELSEIFATYIKMLDAYLRWHFLPPEYGEKDFSATSDYFYKIPVKLVTSPNKIRARTLVSQDYQFLKDLEYLNCRLNERQICNASGKLFWFESAFK
jgi:hypothetical protein